MRVSLNSSLQTIGISSAKGVQLPELRDQFSASTPSSASTSSAATSDNTQTDKKKTESTVAPLTPAQLRQIEQLKSIDANVHAHEQAHMAVGRDLITSGPNYSYTYGPDGKRYATGGEVGIDTSPEQKPQENIAKGRHIVETALAPSDPSSQDYQVAAVGTQLAAQGQVDLAKENNTAAQQKLAQVYGNPEQDRPNGVSLFA